MQTQSILLHDQVRFASRQNGLAGCQPESDRSMKREEHWIEKLLLSVFPDTPEDTPPDKALPKKAVVLGEKEDRTGLKRSRGNK